MEHRRGLAQYADGGYGGQRVRDQRLGPVPVQLGAPVADQPVREPLEQLELGLLGQVRQPQAPLAVPAVQQHRQGGRVELLAARGQEAAPFAVQGADEPAQQRIGGQPGQVRLGAYGLQQ